MSANSETPVTRTDVLEPVSSGLTAEEKRLLVETMAHFFPAVLVAGVRASLETYPPNPEPCLSHLGRASVLAAMGRLGVDYYQAEDRVRWAMPARLRERVVTHLMGGLE